MAFLSPIPIAIRNKISVVFQLIILYLLGPLNVSNVYQLLLEWLFPAAEPKLRLPIILCFISHHARPGARLLPHSTQSKRFIFKTTPRLKMG